jgi:AcrR family transcriptional regulator
MEGSMPLASKAVAPGETARSERPTRSGNRRIEIIRKTARLFVECGYETTSMGEIAEANSISKPGLYYHFASKQDLLAAIIDRAHDQLEGGLEAATGTLADPAERLRATIYAHAIGITTEADDAAFSILAVEEIHSLLPSDRDRIARRKRAYVDLIRGLLDELAAEGRTYPIDTTAAAFTIAGMVLWIPKWYLPGGRLSGDEVAEEITNLVIRSVLKPA